MKKKTKRKAGLLAAAACLTTALLAAPVSAAISDAEKDTLALTVHDYLESVFVLTEDYYEPLRASGGFYEHMIDALEATDADTGDLVSVGAVQVEDTGEAVVCTATVDFEVNDAEVVMTFDATGQNPQDFEVNVQYPQTLGEKMSEAGINTVIGLVVVFAILFFLTGVIYLFGYISRGKGQNEKTEKKQAPQPAAAPAPAAPVNPAVPAGAPEEDVELAIVLAAAIAMAEEEEPSGDGYVVRSVRKAGTSRRWKRV